ncbi:helix-turn-helix domain-containing protein [Polaribacter uvawellassae]|uniref:helix-turn-helix domain-containing protein n=1 Tax=Polaribacter uvawellassae TaxID=3133495 RepID=UPI00321BE0E5
MKLFLFFQALLTLFISGGLFFKENKLKNKALALYFLLFTYEILNFIYGTTIIFNFYPEFHGRFYFSIGVLYGPLLWFHFKSITDNKKRIELKDFWHFLPLLVLNIYMFDIIIMPDEERIAYFNIPEVFYNRILFINFYKAIHQITYAFLLFKILWSSKSQISINQKFYLGGITIIYVITTIVITLLILFANSWRDFSLYYVISIIFVFIIGVILFVDPKFFRTIKEKYQGSYLDEKSMKIIYSQIENELLTGEIFLNNKLSLDILSSKLDIKPQHISQTLSELVKENFNDFVNRHRVEYSKKLLTAPSHVNYKIEAIAQDSGFNNKVTFYKAFSKFTNTTPSQYRKNNKK